MKSKDFTAKAPGKILRNLQGQATFVPNPLPPLPPLILQPAQAMQLLNLTYPSAQNSVQKLVSAGTLSEIKPRTLPARFVASEILKGVNAEPSRR